MGTSPKRLQKLALRVPCSLHLEFERLFSKALLKAKRLMKRVVFASQGGSVRPRTRCQEPMRKHRGVHQRDPKMRIINVSSRRMISEIKLKRTDTTLDLSQKANCDTLLAAMAKNVWGTLEVLTRAGFLQRRGREIEILIVERDGEAWRERSTA